jgi:hypothetical protein
LVAVPLIDFTGAQGTSVQVTVMGFAMMWMDSYDGHGSNKTPTNVAVASAPSN